MTPRLTKRWNEPNGYRTVLAIGLPLVVSMTSITVMQFTDRIFLARYSVDAIAAALPAGITQHAFLGFCMGLVSYVNVFVAQYIGADNPRRVGASLWQALYAALIFGVAVALLAPLAEPLFRLGGHAPAVQKLEVVYFQILCLGSFMPLLGAALSGFFSGRGMTRPVMIANLIGMVVNIPLDYAMINGLGPFPELGISGAAWATVLGSAVSTGILTAIVFTRAHERSFGVRSARAFEWPLFKRLLRFGAPGGVQLFMDIIAFSFFVFMVGRLGKTELAATNIALSVDTLAFMPMMGLHVAISTMVGQAMGRGRPEEAMTATRNTMHLAVLYMGGIAAVFLLLPHQIMDLFQPQDLTAAEFAPIHAAGVLLLRFAAFYCTGDGLSLVFFGAIKGAGDTSYVMWCMAISAIFLLILPVYLGVEFFDMGLLGTWGLIIFYVYALAAMAIIRYRKGKWKSMKVIEDQPAVTARDI